MPGFGRIFQQIVQLFFGLLDWDRPGKPPFIEKEILRALQDGIVVFVQLLTAAEKVQIPHDLADVIETLPPRDFLFVDLNDFSWPKRPMDYLVAYFKIHTSLLI